MQSTDLWFNYGCDRRDYGARREKAAAVADLAMVVARLGMLMRRSIMMNMERRLLRPKLLISQAMYSRFVAVRDSGGRPDGTQRIENSQHSRCRFPMSM